MISMLQWTFFLNKQYNITKIRLSWEFCSYLE